MSRSQSAPYKRNTLYCCLTYNNDYSYYLCIACNIEAIYISSFTYASYDQNRKRGIILIVMEFFEVKNVLSLSRIGNRSVSTNVRGVDRVVFSLYTYSSGNMEH